MKKRSLAAAILPVALVSAVLAGCSAKGGTASGTDTTLTIAASAGPTKWDPATFDWGVQLQPQQAAYDTLIHEAPDGSFTPGLATSWKYVNPTTFQMTLRQGVTFTDGSPLNAAVVKANLDHDKVTPGPKTAQLDTIASVATPDTDTVVIHLSTPNPALPYIFSEAMGMIASGKTVADPSSMDNAPDGAGPYKLVASQSVAGDHLTFVKNPDYWDAKDVKFQTVVFKLIADPTAAFNAVRTGQVDMAPGSAQTVSTAKASGLSVLSFAGSMYSVLLQDRAGKLVPALGKVQVRQALNYAVNKDAIAKTLIPGRATSQIFGQATQAYDPSLDNAYPYDPAKAKQLLAAAGYPNGFSFQVLSTPQLDVPLQAIVSDLKQVGVTMTIVDKQPLDYIADRTTAQYPAYFGANTPTDAYLDAANQVMPTGSLNDFRVTDPTIVGMFDKAAAASGQAQNAAYQHLSAEVTNQAWFLTIEQATVDYYYNPKKVTGVVETPGQIVPFISAFAPAN